jgi:hypothetical protein
LPKTGKHQVNRLFWQLELGNKQKMLRKSKISLTLLTLAVFACLSGLAYLQAAEVQPVNICLFWTKGCPHCTLEKEFLAELVERDRQIKLSSLVGGVLMLILGLLLIFRLQALMFG